MEQTKLQNAKTILAAETVRDNAANALDLAKRNLEVTLNQQQNAISSAQIRLRDTQIEAGKLSIESPIKGVIGTIDVDVGQEISPGTVVAKVSSQSTQFALSVTQSVAACPAGAQRQSQHKHQPSWFIPHGQSRWVAHSSLQWVWPAAWLFFWPLERQPSA